MIFAMRAAGRQFDRAVEDDIRGARHGDLDGLRLLRMIGDGQERFGTIDVGRRWQHLERRDRDIGRRLEDRVHDDIGVRRARHRAIGDEMDGAGRREARPGAIGAAARTEPSEGAMDERHVRRRPDDHALGGRGHGHLAGA